MSSIRVATRKDGSVYYQVLYRIREEGRPARQASTSFDDPDAAHRWKDLLDRVGHEAALAVLDARTEQRPRDAMTVVKWCHQYIDGRTGISQDTKDDYRRYVRNDIEPFFEDLPLEALCAAGADQTPPVQRWVLEMEDDDAAPKTIANKHGFLSGALKAAVKRRPPLLPYNPCEDTRLPRRHFEAMFLEPEEFDILYKGLDIEIQKGLSLARWKPLVLFLATTGMRLSEATALNVADVRSMPTDDGEMWTARISKAWKHTAKNSDAVLGAPKTAKGTRTINVPAETVEMLDLDRKPQELLFSTKDGTRITRRLMRNSCWIPLMNRVGDQLPRKPRIHDLRHTCASWMINNGAELADVQQHLGHEDISTTVNVYGHLDRRSGRRASTAISKALVRTTVHTA